MKLKRKRKIIKIVLRCALVFLLGVVLELFYFNYAAVVAMLQGEVAGPVYEMSDMEVLNWDQTDGAYVTGVDPMLVIKGVNAHVGELYVYIDAPQPFPVPRIFYTEREEEGFSGEKSILVQQSVVDEFHVPLDRQIRDLRIDLSEEKGLSLTDVRVAVDPVAKMHFSWAHIVALLIVYLLIVGLNHFQKGPDFSVLIEENRRKDTGGSKNG